MKGSENELNRLIISVILLAASAGAIVTGGLMLDKGDAAFPAVEIIEAESEQSDTAQALAIEDGEKVTVTESAAEMLMVNINTADAEELMKLKGVGEKTAERIIEYRQQKPFEKIEDIMDVNGIGEKKFEDIRDMICV